MTLKSFERALTERQAQVFSILGLSAAIGVFDLEGRLLLKDGQLAHVWGDRMPAFAPESEHRWRGANGEILSLADYPETRALRGETVAPGMHLRLTDDAGADSWLRVSAAPYRGQNGEILGAVATLEDVSEEARNSRRAQQDAARLKAAVNLVGLGLYSWDPHTNELQWDDAVKAMWGLPAHAAVERSFWRSAIHPDDIGRVDDAVRRCLDPGSDGVYDVQYRVIGADNVERWIATRGLTTFEAGKAATFYGVLMDIAEQKRAEDALNSVSRHAPENSTHSIGNCTNRSRAAKQPRSLPGG